MLIRQGSQACASLSVGFSSTCADGGDVGAGAAMRGRRQLLHCFLTRRDRPPALRSCSVPIRKFTVWSSAKSSARTIGLPCRSPRSSGQRILLRRRTVQTPGRSWDATVHMCPVSARQVRRTERCARAGRRCAPAAWAALSDVSAQDLQRGKQRETALRTWRCAPEQLQRGLAARAARSSTPGRNALAAAAPGRSHPACSQEKCCTEQSAETRSLESTV